MTLKTLVNSKEIILCDICNDEIIKLEDMIVQDRVALRICNQWWALNKFHELDICKKHRNEVMTLINKLKETEEKKE